MTAQERATGPMRLLGVSLLLWVTNHIVSTVPVLRWRMLWYRTLMGFELDRRSAILRDVRFARRGNLRLAAGAVVNNGCRLDNRRLIDVGANASISYGCHVFTKGHAIDDQDFTTVAAPVVIVPRSWLCALAIISPGVTINEGAVVLTGAVVSGDVAAFTVVGGNPARYVRDRNRDVDYELDPHARRLLTFG